MTAEHAELIAQTDIYCGPVDAFERRAREITSFSLSSQASISRSHSLMSFFSIKTRN